jgi:lipid-binding SYLF domain-containing protein
LEVESIDLVLVFRIPQSVLEVECGKLDLGAVAAGPIGGPDSVRTSVRSGSEILSYVRIKGAFAGAILGGGVRLVVDSVANEAFYRSNSVRLIFKDRVPVVPAAAVRFVRTVTEATRPGPLADTDEIPR